MGSLVWVLNLWALRIAAGAAVLATMSAAVAMYHMADTARDRVVAAGEMQKGEIDELFAGL